MFSLEIHHCTSSRMLNSSHFLVNQDLHLVKLLLTWPYHLPHSIQCRTRSPQLFHTFSYLHRYIASVGTVSQGCGTAQPKGCPFPWLFPNITKPQMHRRSLPVRHILPVFSLVSSIHFFWGKKRYQTNIFGLSTPPRIPPWQMKGVYMDFPYCKISWNPGD